MSKGRRRVPNRLLTDAFREIRNTRSRFISILVLSALAVCFLAGLRATEPDMKRSADRYFDRQGLMDLRIVSTLGLTGEDVQALADQSGVERAEGAYTVDAVIRLGDNDYVVKAHSLSRQINIPRLLEGRLPQAADELLAEPALLRQTGLMVGDTITLDTGTEAFAGALTGTRFTIVGTADSPLYISMERGSATLGNGKAVAFVLLPGEAFSMDSYTDVYLRLEGAGALQTYSRAYEDLVEGYAARLEQLGEQRAPLRGQQVLGEANQTLAEAEQELADAEREVEEKLARGRAELDDARAQLDQGWKDYKEGLLTFEQGIADAEREITRGEQELAQALQQLTDAQTQLADGRTQLDRGWESYRQGEQAYQQGLEQYQEGQRQYEAGLEEYDRGRKEYEKGKQQLDQGWESYYAGREALAAGQRELTQGQQLLEEQERTFEQGLDALCTSLPLLDPSLRYAGHDELLAAMQDPEQAAAIDGALDRARAQLAGQIAQYDAQIAGYQTQLDEANRSIKELPGQIETLEQQTIPGLDDAIREADGQIRQLRLQLLTEWDSGKRQELQTQLDAIQTRRDGLQEQRTQAQAQLTQARLDLTQAKLTAAGLESQLETAKFRKEQLQSQQTGLYTTVDGQSVPVTTRVLLSGRAQLDRGWADLAEGQQELARGEAQLADSYGELRTAQRQLDDAKDQLDAGWRELETARLQLEYARLEVEAGRTELDQGLQQLEDSERELTAAQARLDQGRKEYEQGTAQLADARKTLAEEAAEGEKGLADARAELEQGERDWTEGEAEYLEGRRQAQSQLADARKTLEQARRDIEAIGECRWYVLDRNTNMGYVSYSMDADRMGNLAGVFPLIFFLVAALVCLTTMTRMVEEQRTAIGGMKALGYSRMAIAVKYVGYGFLASAVGALAGLAVGLFLVPWIICTAWGIMYTTGDIYYSLEPVTSALACLAAVGTVTVAAWGACASALRAVPARLMRPKAPPMGKRILLERITPVWRRLSFPYKITMRNLFRYQKRFWMTVAGIGGCAALIITAFGLRDSIFAVMEKQFDEIYLYDAQVSLVDKATPGELDEVVRVLDDSALVEGWLLCRAETVRAQSGAYTVDATLQVVPGQEALAPFIDLHHRLDRAPVTLPQDGVVLTEKLARLLEVGVGDTFVLDGDSRLEVRVADVTEHYIQHGVYMTRDYYRRLTGGEPADNQVLVDYADGDRSTRSLAEALVALDGVTSLSQVADSRDSVGSSLSAVDYAVVLIIVCAAALAFVVLYNLTNINITERMRELATLKVLGFYDGELSAYVYRENVFLTVFGVLMGMVMGKLLHQWLILTVEIDMLMFGREVAPVSYLYAVVLTTLFSLLVNLSAHCKLKGLDMVQSLKSVE